MTKSWWLLSWFTLCLLLVLQGWWLWGAFDRAKDAYQQRIENSLTFLREIIDPGDEIFLLLDRLGEGEPAEGLSGLLDVAVNNAVVRQDLGNPAWSIAQNGQIILGKTSGKHVFSRPLDRNCCDLTIQLHFRSSPGRYAISSLKWSIFGVLVVTLSMLAVMFLAYRINVSWQKRHQRQTELIHQTMHELNNPIASIQTGLKLLSGHTRVDVLNPMNKALERLLSHRDAIFRAISLEKLDQQEIAEWHLRELIHSTVEMFDKTRIRITVSGPEKWNGDAHLMKSVVENVLDNALKYSESIVELDVVNQGDHCVLKFKDEGIGISEEDLKHVFQPYYRVEKTIAPGLGMGLFHVKRILDLMGGQISIRSELGSGTEVEIRIPQ